MKKVILKLHIIFIDLPRFSRNSGKKHNQNSFCYRPKTIR